MRTNASRITIFVLASMMLGLPVSATAAASSLPCYGYNCNSVVNPPARSVPCHHPASNVLRNDFRPSPLPLRERLNQPSDDDGQPGQPGQGLPGQPGHGDGQPGQPGQGLPGQPGHGDDQPSQPAQGEPGQAGESVSGCGSAAPSSTAPVAGVVLSSTAGLVVAAGAAAYMLRRRDHERETGRSKT